MTSLKEIRKRLYDLESEIDQNPDSEKQNDRDELDKLYTMLNTLQDEYPVDDFQFLMNFIYI